MPIACCGVMYSLFYIPFRIRIIILVIRPISYFRYIWTLVVSRFEIADLQAVFGVRGIRGEGNR